jgi:hypothetical protein
MKSAIDGANQLSMNNVLEQLIKVINHNFDFCKKVSINMELMQLNAAQMAKYGIVIGIPQLTLMLLANFEMATNSNYDRKFHSAMNAIRKKYSYNHMHNATLLQTILKELASANGVRVGTSTGRRNRAFGCQIGILPPSNDWRGHQPCIHQIGTRREFQQQLVQRRMQTTCMQMQEIPMFRVARQMGQTEEGQG